MKQTWSKHAFPWYLAIFSLATLESFWFLVFSCHNFPDTLDQYDMTLIIAMDLVLSWDLIRLSSHVFHPFPSSGDWSVFFPVVGANKKRVRATASDVSPATKKREVQGRDQKDMWGLGSEPMEIPCCSHRNFAGIHGCPRRTGIDNFIAIDP